MLTFNIRKGIISDRCSSYPQHIELTTALLHLFRHSEIDKSRFRCVLYYAFLKNQYIFSTSCQNGKLKILLHIVKQGKKSNKAIIFIKKIFFACILSFFMYNAVIDLLGV